MEAVEEIKMRLPIEELVGQYCQLKKKGRNFVCLCPFHKDSNPSLVVSPDKGIAYCFACQGGGDIFSFYQQIEHVDFREALKELGEKTGVEVAALPEATTVKKDEKERARHCLEVAERFYKASLSQSQVAIEYLKGRGIDGATAKEFGIGYAPNSFSDTYQMLLKEGFSRSEILLAGLGVQKDLSDEKIYDRFRNRIMFPIADASGQIVGFGGRTLGDSDAKYINSSDGPLYHKSEVLYGLDKARDTIRDEKKVIMVEGYFDVIACHKLGIKNVVAVSGTALTEQHAKILKRHADTIVLCLDQDNAGRAAAERAFLLLTKQELRVQVVTLPAKDPDESAQKEPGLTKQLLSDGGVPYIDSVLSELQKFDTSSADGKRMVLERLLPLLDALTSSVEREHYTEQTRQLLQITETALEEDLLKFRTKSVLPTRIENTNVAVQKNPEAFSRVQIALGLIFCYPKFRHLLTELIEPETGEELALYIALKDAPDEKHLTVEMLDIPALDREKVSILQLFCEHHGFTDWSDIFAEREIHKSIRLANRDTLLRKQKIIIDDIRKARNDGKKNDETHLSQQLDHIMKLVKRAS